MGLNLVNNFGINNAIIPKNGPKTVTAILDFSAAAEIEIDGEQVVSLGRIEYLQGVFIDNSDYAVPLSLSIGTTGQRIVCPPNSQGYFSIMAPNPPRMVARMVSAANRKVPVFFYNVPIQSAVWKTV